MKSIGMLRAWILCLRYPKLNSAQREALRTRRLRALVKVARARSPLYAQLYRDVAEDFTLGDLPPVRKLELMEHWDDWVTDRAAKLADVQTFMQNLDNVGRKFRGRYLVFTTSGSTGNPLVMLCDSTTNAVMGAVNIARGIANPQVLRALIRRGSKTMGVFATGGFYLSNGSVRARQLQMPWKKNQMRVISALLPLPEIVQALNAFQPAMLGGYPSPLELLVEEQRSGRLSIHPLLIMTGGEFLSDVTRASLAQAFGCPVQTSYSCTEGGTLACECREQHFHINEDWVTLEPVDAQNRPVPDGLQADKLLLTNLFNYTQPFIRYELTDRVTLHREPCACGNPSPWLTLEGRTDDVLTFTQDGRSIRVAPLPLYATLKEAHALRRFQLVAHPGNRLLLRLEAAQGFSPEDAFAQASARLLAYLHTQGVTEVSLAMDVQPPRQHPVSGKFKHILNGASETEPS